MASPRRRAPAAASRGFSRSTSGRPPIRATTPKSPEASVQGRPRASTTSRARNGVHGRHPGDRSKEADDVFRKISDHAGAPARGSLDPEVGAQRRFDPDAHRLPDRGDRDDHRQRHAERHRERGHRDAVAGERAAEEAAAEAARFAEHPREERGAARAPVRDRDRRHESERHDHERHRSETEEGKAVHRGRRGRSGGGGDREQGGGETAVQSAAAYRFDRAGPQRGGRLDARGLESREESRAERREHSQSGRDRGRPAVVGRRDLRRRKIDAFDGRGDRRQRRSGQKDAGRLAERGARGADHEALHEEAPRNSIVRETPIERSAAISGLRRRTEIETAFRDQEHPDEKRQRAERVQIESERADHARRRRGGPSSGGSSDKPGRKAREETPPDLLAVGARPQGDVPRGPPGPPCRVAAARWKRSVTSRSPPDAFATPTRARRPATVTRRRTPPARIERLAPAVSSVAPPASASRARGRRLLPAARRARVRRGSGHERHLPHGRVAADVHPEDLDELSRAVVHRPPSRSRRARKEPNFQRNDSRSSAAIGDAAHAGDDEVAPARRAPRPPPGRTRWTLAFARWIAATAATPTATPRTGSANRIGRLRAGPEHESAKNELPAGHVAGSVHVK
jgi:hypothetical protein